MLYKEVLLKTENNRGIYAISIPEELSKRLVDFIHSDLKDITVSLKSDFVIKREDIIAVGEITNPPSLVLLREIIEDVSFVQRIGNGVKLIKSYKCFAYNENELKHGHIVMHEDRGSSWNCLMEVMEHPKYLLIYKK